MLIDAVIIEKLSGEHEELAQKAVKGIADVNYRLSKKILSKRGEHIVRARASELAYKIALYLYKNKIDPKNYVALRKNGKLRSLGAAGFFIDGKKCGYADVYDTSGIAVIHPNREVEGRNFGEWKDKYPRMWEKVKESFAKPEVSGYYKFLDEHNNTRDKFMAIRRIPGTKLNLTIAVNIDEYFIPVHREIKEAETAHLNSVKKDIKASSEALSTSVKTMSLMAVIALALLCVLFGFWFAGTLSRPIVKLRDGVKNIGRGNFEVKVEEKGSLETKELAIAFNSLGRELATYMDNLKKEVSARQAVESEINIARDIQQSLLPRTFPPFPERKEFEIYASLTPAKEVAGDFYDYFFIDKNKLAIIIGDVSGKGIPAAFFMAVSRTLIKNICMQERNPAKALSRTNDVLSIDNDAAMFVTLFLAYYNIETGELQYANGGHHQALITDKNANVRSFGMCGDPALGIIPEYEYKSGEFLIKTGEIMILFTDGITEAPNKSHEQFGEERLTQLLIENNHLTLKETSAKVIENVLEFEKGKRFDDITLVLFKRLI